MRETRRKRGKGLSEEELGDRFPSLKTLAVPDEAAKRSWVAAFNARPDSMYALIADFIKQVHAKPGQIGQRPLPREEQVDFQALVYGDMTDEPLHVALPKLSSARRMAAITKINRERVRLAYAGQYSPDVAELRLMAAAVNKPPSFFLEYRKAMAISAFVNLLEESPGIAATLYLNYIEVRMREVA